MHTIHLIDKLDYDENGPLTIVNDDNDYVFLNQGSLDGACGYYSVMMSLIINGLISRDEALNSLGFQIDGRTHLGKLANRMRSPAFFFGTYDFDLEELFHEVFSKQLYAEAADKENVRKFIYENLKDNHPVIVAIEWNDGAHWAVAVGMDYSGQDDNKELYRLLLIDPSGTPMSNVPWNAVLDVRPKKGAFPYDYWGLGRVKIREAVAMKRLDY